MHEPPGPATTMMPIKDPHPIDRHVGSRVRLRRTLIGMSQDRLGGLLGVTFQQVQKYEKGTNRVSASRLWQIAGILGVQVAFFFEGMTDGAAAGFAEAEQTSITGLAYSTEALQLLRHFTQIDDPRVRRAVVELARALAAAKAGEAGPDS